jgi:hypothetical protein
MEKISYEEIIYFHQLMGWEIPEHIYSRPFFWKCICGDDGTLKGPCAIWIDEDIDRINEEYVNKRNAANAYLALINKQRIS